MVEVMVNGQYLDVISKTVKYVKQANDLADPTTVNASFTYSIEINKTPRNTRIFSGLGIKGDTSRFPYNKNRTRLWDNGIMLISDGVSTVKDTGENYHLIIQDGIVDFFRRIENKSIGNDLDLSELSHTKNATNIVASFDNTDYKYLISEYNGWTVRDGTLNPDYQVPSINQKYIFDKIMAFAGYTYEGLPDISNEWTTFPTPPVIPTDEEILRFDGFYSVIDNIEGNWTDWQDVFFPMWTNIFFHDTDFLELIDDWKLKILQTGNYKNVFNVNGSMLYGVLVGNQLRTFRLPIKMVLYNNGNEVATCTVGSGNVTTFFNGGAANVLHYYPRTLTREEAEDAGLEDEDFLNALETGDFYILQINISAFNADISTMGVEVFDFGQAFKDYSMTDFMKELMFRKSLTPFPNTDARHIKFMTMAQRFSTDNEIDWSKKYIERIGEGYDFGSYAKQNLLLMKHDEDDDTFGNGQLPVNNDNLNDNRTMFQSRYFAPSGLLKLIRNIGGEFFLGVKFWEREVKDDDGTQTIEYKPLSNRFFLLKEQTVNKTITIGDIEVNSFPKAIMDGTKMSDVVSEYYGDFWKVFADLRIHEIELAINSHDVATLELDRPYYFEKEGAFYILNKLSYETGKPAKGEFLKLKQ